MPRRPMTAFDRFVSKKRQDPAFAAEYEAARAEVDAVDAVVRALDEARERRGLSKADLARRADMQPDVLRRLLTSERPNPTPSVAHAASAEAHAREGGRWSVITAQCSVVSGPETRSRVGGPRRRRSR
jgi:hypothetical protein